MAEVTSMKDGSVQVRAEKGSHLGLQESLDLVACHYMQLAISARKEANRIRQCGGPARQEAVASVAADQFEASADRYHRLMKTTARLCMRDGREIR
jgi:hypothetical protein